MRHRRQSGFELLMALPWYVAAAIGAVLYVGASSIAGLIAGASPILSQLHPTLVTLFRWAALVCLAAAALSALRSYFLGRRFAQQRTLDDLRALTWQQFESIVGEAFRRKGYSVIETGQGGADGGVDLMLSKNGQRYLVQCKQYRASTVSVMTVREIFGVVAARRAAGAIVVTTGTFTKDAVDFARGQPIELIDGVALVAMVRDINAAGGAAPLSVNAPAVAADPGCPKCGAPMLKRTAKASGAEFLGCSTFPKCRGTRPVA